ncbi:FtsX-like permease family protein [Gluconobacter cerinus]|uniref:ABC transporter permease n=1 Tax=Gluconobacter TaxID=441 RepID=UPI001B8B6687|nr:MULTISPECIES: ABC transporter permease [Gluconobacter]MBS1089910.1 ABC transporter permease [Gluconobacter wancherniae]
MLRLSLVSLWRSIQKRPLFAALNILGLGFGLAVFLTLATVGRYEFSFDHSFPGASTVYRLDQVFNVPGQPAFETDASSFAAYGALRRDYHGIVSGSRLMQKSIMFQNGNSLFTETVSFVDPEFLLLLPLSIAWTDGTPHALAPGDLLISKRLALKYFGAQDAAGRSLTLKSDGKSAAFRIAGVFQPLPSNTTLDLDAVTAFDSTMLSVSTFKSWGATPGVSYLRIPSAAYLHLIAASMPAFVDKNAGPLLPGTPTSRVIGFRLVPFEAQHFHDATVIGDDKAGDESVVLGLVLVGALALGAAAINYVNLATAQALLRAREVAIRKVLGASRRELIGQYLFESTALVVVAGLFGLALTDSAVPFVAELGGWQLGIDWAFVLPILAVMVLVVGIGSGLYPALILAGYEPAIVLAAASYTSAGRMGSRVRSVLVTVQLAFAITLAICTSVMYFESVHLRVASRGYDRSGLVEITSARDPGALPMQASLLDAFRSAPGVESVTIASVAPGTDQARESSVIRPGLLGRPPVMGVASVGRDFFSTYRVSLLAGRPFDDAHGADAAPEPMPPGRTYVAMLDKTAAAALGYGTPGAAVGQVITFANASNQKVQAEVVGVIPSLRMDSEKGAARSTVYIYQPNAMAGAVIVARYRGVSAQYIAGELEQKWRTLVPNVPWQETTVEEALASFYLPDLRRDELFTAGTGCALLVACMGLYGLAAFNATRRLREVGLRKALGATGMQTLLLLVGQILRPVIIGSVIAWPVSWILMRRWLDRFDERINLSPTFFVVVTVLAIALCVLTVLGQTMRLAFAEPASALRMD